MSNVNLALTTAGQALKAKIEAGKGDIPLNITRIVTASGTSNDPLSLNAVVNEEQQFTITKRQTTGARTAITALLVNFGNLTTGEKPLENGYPLSQIGFYADDPDYGEILYRISQFDVPNYVPAARERGWTYEPTFNFITGNASEVIVHIDPAGFTIMQDIWDSVEYSDADIPNVGTRIHLHTVADAPYYRPKSSNTDPSISEVTAATLRVDRAGEVEGIVEPDGGGIYVMALQM